MSLSYTELCCLLDVVTAKVWPVLTGNINVDSEGGGGGHGVKSHSSTQRLRPGLSGRHQP